MMPKIYICGKGNVGTALLQGFLKAGIQPEGIYSRKKGNDYLGVPVINFSRRPKAGSIIFLAVPDDNIVAIADRFGKDDVYLVHCSGSVELKALTSSKAGVFYPLQTWSKGMLAEWKGVPVFLESKNKDLLEHLMSFAKKLKADPHIATSSQRRSLHLAAVFANNFGNAVFDIAFDLAEEAGIEPKTLLPLIQKTVQKLNILTPEQAQTGPARRGDEAVLKKHMEMLKNVPDIAVLYEKMSEYIRKKKLE